jgi:hypothetical protein
VELSIFNKSTVWQKFSTHDFTVVDENGIGELIEPDANGFFTLPVDLLSTAVDGTTFVDNIYLTTPEDSPLLDEVKQFMKLPPPYKETINTEEGSSESTNTGIEPPPTMMEQVNDKQSKSTDGGNQ